MNAQNISFFSSIAKEKHGKKEKKFDKTFFFYIISPHRQESNMTCFVYAYVYALCTDARENVAQLVEQSRLAGKVAGSVHVWECSSVGRAGPF